MADARVSLKSTGVSLKSTGVSLKSAVGRRDAGGAGS